MSKDLEIRGNKERALAFLYDLRNLLKGHGITHKDGIFLNKHGTIVVENRDTQTQWLVRGEFSLQNLNELLAKQTALRAIRSEINMLIRGNVIFGSVGRRDGSLGQWISKDKLRPKTSPNLDAAYLGVGSYTTTKKGQ